MQVGIVDLQPADIDIDADGPRLRFAAAEIDGDRANIVAGHLFGGEHGFSDGGFRNINIDDHAVLQAGADLQAVLYVDLSSRDDLLDEMEIELKLDHLPDITYVANVTQVSPRGERTAPESLTTRFNGPLATTSDPQGKEKLASTAYRAIVELHFQHHPQTATDALLMEPGMRGNARFLVANRTAWQWAYRYVRETFRFKV